LAYCIFIIYVLNFYMKRFLCIVACVATVALPACRQSPEKELPAGGPASDSVIATEEMGKINGSGNPPVMDPDRQIIRSADISLSLKDFALFHNSLRTIVRRLGAYVAEEEQQAGSEGLSGKVVIKVPAAGFDAFIEELYLPGVTIRSKHIQAEDVTGELYDDKGRQETRRQVRESYLGLLKRAGSMKEVLEVQNEVNAVTTQIEAAAGRIQYLQQQSAYSTVRLQYNQLPVAGEPDVSPQGFPAKAWQAVQGGGHFIAELLLFCLRIWPFLLTGVVVWYFIRREKMVIKNNKRT
jgi:hypothetical protein